MSKTDISEEFLELFKKVESKIVSICNLDDDDFIPYSRALNHIHAKMSDPIISNDRNYAILKKAGDLRNLLSHNHDLCVPTKTFFDTFKKLADRLVNDDNIYSICNKKIIYVKSTYTLKTCINLFLQNKLTHLPILNDEHQVKGVLSRNSIFDYICLHKDTPFSIEHMEVKDFYEVSKLDLHQNERFIFVSRNTSIRECYQKLITKEVHGKSTALFFLTEHGLAQEKLIGIVTMADFTIAFKKIL